MERFIRGLGPKLDARRPHWFDSSCFPRRWMVLSNIMLPMTVVFFLQTHNNIGFVTAWTPLSQFANSSTAIPHPKKPPDPDFQRELPTWVKLQKENYSSDFHDMMAQKYHSKWAIEDSISVEQTGGFALQGEQPDGFVLQGEQTALFSEKQITTTSNSSSQSNVPTYTRPQKKIRTGNSYFPILREFIDDRFIIAMKSTTYKEEDLFPIIFDTGCSTSMTFCKDDFLQPPMIGNFGSVQTADGKLKVSGLGMVSWEVVCTDGTSRTLELPAHYVEGGHKIRLFSPQDYARYHEMPQHQDAFGGNSTGCWLKFPESDSVLFAHMDGGSNVPMILATNGERPNCKVEGCGCTNGNHLAQSVLSETNTNLTKSQKELLLDHFRLGHFNMQTLQRLYRTDKDSDQKPCLVSRSQQLNVDIPLCQACQISKAKRRPTSAKQTRDLPERMSTLSTNHLEPGDSCSVDQYESSARGRLLNTQYSRKGEGFF